MKAREELYNAGNGVSVMIRRESPTIPIFDAPPFREHGLEPDAEAAIVLTILDDSRIWISETGYIDGVKAGGVMLHVASRLCDAGYGKGAHIKTQYAFTREYNCGASLNEVVQALDDYFKSDALAEFWRKQSPEPLTYAKVDLRK